MVEGRVVAVRATDEGQQALLTRGDPLEVECHDVVSTIPRDVPYLEIPHEVSHGVHRVLDEHPVATGIGEHSQVPANHFSGSIDLDVALIEDDVIGAITIDVTDLDIGRIRHVHPILTSGSVVRDPDVRAFLIGPAIVPQYRQEVAHVTGGDYVLIAVTIEVAGGEVEGVTGDRIVLRVAGRDVNRPHQHREHHQADQQQAAAAHITQTQFSRMTHHTRRRLRFTYYCFRARVRRNRQ